MVGSTANKAIGGGVAALLLTFLGFIEPLANHIPVLGVIVGIGTFILTWLTPKNAEPKTS